MEHGSDEETREQSQENAEEAQEERDENTQQEEEIKEEKMQEKEDDKDVEMVGNGKDSSHNQRSRANTNTRVTATEHVIPATLEAELQCIICQYIMFKPISVVCGHSFCRVCLLDSLLTRSLEEAQCPICRVDILQPFVAKSSLTSVFSINVTLWNLGQLLIPSLAKKIQSYHQEEEHEFASKLDQLDSKWKVFTLSERAAQYHGDEEQEHTRSSGRWEEEYIGNDEYPVLKVEDTRDSDENEDGYVNMRVGLAIVEFPTIFELYNEHQECSVNVIKMEEDEEMADGMPFFMNDDGDDDGFVCSSYYNEISLHVCDEAGNCVMERTRGAQGGVVTFLGLRLDVPGGMYTFRFSDDLYGLKLSITTCLREPHEILDTPVADFVSLIHDEARDASRRNRIIHHDSDSECEFDEEGDESDDLFIVDDCIGEEHNEQPIGRFSDDDGDDQGEYHSGDKGADEEREQLRTRQRQRSSRRFERDVSIVVEHHDDGALSDEEGERSDGHDNMDEREEDEEVDDEVRPGRRNIRVVEGLFSLDGEADQKGHDDSVDAANESDTEEEQHDVVRPRQQNANQIVDSDDEDKGEGGPVESDEEEKADDDSGGVPNDHDEERTEHSHDEDDTVAPNSTRKVNRGQWFQDGESDDDDKADAADEVSERRPRKQSRKVRIIDEGESDKEQMERSIMSMNNEQANDDDDIDEMNGNDAQFQHLFDEEDEERNELDDAEEEKDDALDLDDEEENEEKEDEDYW
ncbi:unnamed protein product [Peronospora destructor]|uniref:RING-type domain-containing protein n=1 Tax=Peronospora destructor TaxID=86335 RepID=A0AAV0UDX5_9STRA|nr:unnamed protein product [Peronospora destructor]